MMSSARDNWILYKMLAILLAIPCELILCVINSNFFHPIILFNGEYDFIQFFPHKN